MSVAQFAIALTALSLVVANPTLAFAQTDPAIEADHQVGSITDYMGDICQKDGYDGASAIPVDQWKP